MIDRRLLDVPVLSKNGAVNFGEASTREDRENRRKLGKAVPALQALDLRYRT
jgi:hypothetical protein